MSQPWFKFFPSDWCGDRALRACSLGARGLWMEMLAIMSEASPRGSLMINGRPIEIQQLAACAGASNKEVARYLQELEVAGVFSRDPDGTVYSRRMRRDEARAERDKLNGKRGGNPSLKGADKPSDKQGVNPLDANSNPRPAHSEVNPGVNPQDKAQKPEARG